MLAPEAIAIIFLSLGTFSEAHIYTPGTPPAPGTLWPMPQEYITTSQKFEIQPNNFFMYSGSDCSIVQNALRRYRKLIFVEDSAAPPSGKPLVQYMSVIVRNSSDCGYPRHGMNENYTLSVTQYLISLKADTPWGALRGLETFSQMVYVDEITKNYFLNGTLITDYPRFGFRGVLLDTARHFIPVSHIKQNLDAMAMNKFNVFHWHIVDDQSWPLQLKTYPNLTDGAYNPKFVYSQEDVKDIIEYARQRGIRVIPEIDTPGHSRALGQILPEIHTPCESGQAVLNVARDYTFEVINNIIKEVNDLFPDEYFHLGMDEVDYTCWKNSPEITEFMKINNLTTYPEVEQYYVRKTLQNVKQLGAKYVIWQDPIDNGVVAAPDTVVGVWLDHYGQNQSQKLDYQIILSAPWYLNRISEGQDWITYYKTEPTQFPAIAAQKQYLVGGEACMWAEWVDSTNLFPRMWPRASAVAERLWSAAAVDDADEAKFRLDEQRCRMLRRGYPAQPLMTGYCGDYEIDLLN